MTTSSGGLRIALVAPLFPLRGGIAHHSACLARALSARGVDVCAVSYRRLYPRVLFAGTTELDRSARPIAWPGAHPALVPWDPLTWARAFARVEAHDPALVVIPWWHSFQLPLVSALLSAFRARGRRTLLLCHNVASHEAALLDAAAWSLLPHLPHAFLVHGSRQAEVLHDRIVRARARPRPVLVAPHPTYDVFAELSHAQEPSAIAARKRLGLREDAEVVLMFGLVRRYKGLELALRAMQEIAQRRPRAVLVVAGEHYERPHRRIPSGTHVLVHDRFIPNEQVADYFRAADVVIAPYRPGPSHSGVVQIARAFGAPVVGVDGEGLRELVTDGVTGLLPDASGLASALERVLSDVALRQHLSSAMLASAADFTWSAFTDVVVSAAAPP